MKCIHVLRKPCSGTTVAANVLTHGCGAINVDACRVGYESTPNPATNPLYRKEANYKNTNYSDAGSSSYSLKDGSGERNPNAGGRWPANLVLQHLDGCKQAGVRQVKSSHVNKPHAKLHAVDFGGAKPMDAHGYGAERATSTFRGVADKDGKETVVAYDCAPGCPVAALDEQSGMSTSTGGRASVGAFKGGRAFGVGNGAEVLPGVQPGLGDTGGASRYFKQFTTPSGCKP